MDQILHTVKKKNSSLKLITLEITFIIFINLFED